ncbi:MAG: T9SS type A sorting domain-containing protein [Flavobacteriales bacterium]|nr:T9SS type A sorting domain-containing protein [Flavobacteriales bacterium]
MRVVLVILLFVESAASLAQGWQRRYDMRGEGWYQNGAGIENAFEGYMLFTKSDEEEKVAPGTTAYFSTVFLTRISLLGDTISQRRHILPNHALFPGWANCCDTVGDEGYILGGSSQSFEQEHRVHLMRFDRDGDTLWTRRFGSAGHYWIGRQVKHTRDGGFLIVGDTDGSGGDDGFALKTDADGNEQWRQVYGGSWLDYFIASDAAVDGYILGGVKFLSTDNSQFWVQRIDLLGAVRWSQVWGGPFEEASAHLIATRDGNCVVASAWGYALDFLSTKPYLAKLDSSDGTIIWDREYGPATYSTSFFAVKENPDNDLIACGVSYYTGQQGLLLRTTAEGDSLWMRSYFYQDAVIQEGQGRFYDVLPTADGGFIATGAAYNPRNMGYPAGYSQDTWVVKVDGDGCLVPGCCSVGIAEQATNLLDALRIWPNPVQAGGLMNIELDLPPTVQGKPLQLSVVDAGGKVVHVEQVIGAGPFALALSHLGTGLYYMHVQSGSTWYTGGKLLVE